MQDPLSFSYKHSVWQDSVKPIWLRSQWIKWIEAFSNQSDGNSLGIKNCVIMFQPSSANIRVELCRLYSMFGVMTPRGKTYRYSPLCSQQAVDSVSENDEEVEQILSQSPRPQLNPPTLLVSFIWSVFASNLPTISQRWNAYVAGQKIWPVVFFPAFPWMELIDDDFVVLCLTK